jgi:hypothetical protein
MNARIAAVVVLALACAGHAWADVEAEGEMAVSSETLPGVPPPASINGVTFDMTRAQVTNVLERFRPTEPPKGALPVVAYEIFRLREPRIGIGNARPDVLVGCTQAVYFNQSNQVVAIEMQFDNLDIDKVQHILNKLQDKYTSLPSDRENTYNYEVNPQVKLRTTVAATQYSSDPIGGPRRNMSTVRNLYMYETRYREALKDTNKAVIIDNLL